MTESPSMLHNRKLMSDLLNKHGNPPRYLSVTDQVELLPLEISKLPAHSFNPSLYRHHGKTLLTYRYHPVQGDFKTRIGLAELGDKGNILKLQDLDLGETSCEDARLFLLQMEPWISWVSAKWEGKYVNPKSVVKFAKLECPHNDDASKRRWNVGRVYQPKTDANDWTIVQKNWVFFQVKEHLFCIYKSWPEQIVFKFEGDANTAQFNTPGPSWPYGEIRGGNIIPWGDKLLRVFHSKTTKGVGNFEIRYYIGACLMESEPPFTVLSVSRKPVIYGSELPNVDCFHFKPNVAFPTGLVQDGKNALVSVGINDCISAVARVRENQLNL